MEEEEEEEKSSIKDLKRRAQLAVAWSRHVSPVPYRAFCLPGPMLYVWHGSCVAPLRFFEIPSPLNL